MPVFSKEMCCVMVAVQFMVQGMYLPLYAQAAAFSADTNNLESNDKSRQISEKPVSDEDIDISRPAASSGYYGGAFNRETGADRGVAAGTASPQKKRMLFTDTLPKMADLPYVSSDTASAVPAAAELPPDSDSLQLSNRPGLKGKIIAACGTAVIACGAVALILYKKQKDSAGNSSDRIPDPPGPPGI